MIQVNEPNLSEMVAVTTFSEKAREKTEAFAEALGIKKIVKVGGTGYKIMSIVENKADVFPVVLEASSWDICAPQAILEAAGGIIEYIDGTNVSYGAIIKIKQPLLIGKSRKQMDFMREKTSHLFS